MNVFTKKAKVVLGSEEQKDAFIEKLEMAHIEYEIREDMDLVFNDHMTYIVRFPAADMKKVG